MAFVRWRSLLFFISSLLISSISCQTTSKSVTLTRPTIDLTNVGLGLSTVAMVAPGQIPQLGGRALQENAPLVQTLQRNNPLSTFNGKPIQSFSLDSLTGVVTSAPIVATTPAAPQATTTFWGYLPDKPYPFVLPPPDIPYFGSKWVGPWGYPIGHYQAFRGTGQYITHYEYYPLSYFGSLMAPFAYGMSGKK